MQAIEQSLAEQLKIDAFEIARRKEMLSFTRDDEVSLSCCGELARAQVDALVDQFYARQTADPEIAVIIGDAETLRRLRAAQRRYVLDLFEGFYDLPYVNNRLRIGMVHKRIGVEPKFYMAGMVLLRTLLHEMLEVGLKDTRQRHATCIALDKLLAFDTTLVFDTYIRSLLTEIETAHARMVRYAENLEQQVAERTRELAHESTHDALTGLYNRRAFAETMRRELSRAQRSHMPLSLVFFDIDNFKALNDQYGHGAGDDALRRVARAITQVMRNEDLAFRYGGDEFCIVLPGADLPAAYVICNRLRGEVGCSEIGVTLSVGVVCTGPLIFESADELVVRADTLMYAGKKSGPGQVVSEVSPRSDGADVQTAPPGEAASGVATPAPAAVHVLPSANQA